MKKTILFIDDEEINLFVLAKRFEEDYVVLTANSALDAIEIIQNEKERLDAVISDVKMPDMSGLELIEKTQDNLKDIPCFLLTGYDNNEEIEKALHNKTVEKLFKKPFNYHEISNTLSEFLQL